MRREQNGSLVSLVERRMAQERLQRDEQWTRLLERLADAQAWAERRRQAVSARRSNLTRSDLWDERDTVEGFLVEYLHPEFSLQPTLVLMPEYLERIEPGLRFKHDRIWIESQHVFAVFDDDGHEIWCAGRYDRWYRRSRLANRPLADADTGYIDKVDMDANWALDFEDLKLWLALGLRAKVYLPSLREGWLGSDLDVSDRQFL